MNKECKTCGDTKVKWVGHLHKRHRMYCSNCVRYIPKPQENKK